MHANSYRNARLPCLCKGRKITEDERKAIVDFIASNPDAGDIMSGTGGARKVRFAKPGTGKSGGYRIITFYVDNDIPVFLLDIYSKGTQANLSKSERNELRKILTDLPQVWRNNVREQVRQKRRQK